tara:strand:+ start:198 stop:563 length:366 start_codon:yes stop_codon:yes gene_type:complete
VISVTRNTNSVTGGPTSDPKNIFSDQNLSRFKMKIGKYNYEKSTRKGKKLMTIVNGKTIHFGDSKMEQYKDKTGIWKSKDHGDKERRKAYLSRAKGIKNKGGDSTYLLPESPNYHSVKILW